MMDCILFISESTGSSLNMMGISIDYPTTIKAICSVMPQTIYVYIYMYKGVHQHYIRNP